MNNNSTTFFSYNVIFLSNHVYTKTFSLSFYSLSLLREWLGEKIEKGDCCGEKLTMRDMVKRWSKIAILRVTFFFLQLIFYTLFKSEIKNSQIEKVMKSKKKIFFQLSMPHSIQRSK